MKGPVQNALTIDLEDWFQVAAFFPYIPYSKWEALAANSSRVRENTDRLLAILDASCVRATFFVLGWIAERFPDLIKEVSSCGHEIACHGYSHQLVYNQSRALFKEETHRAKCILEDIVAKPVEGYRASTYSITPGSFWAFDVLLEEGFRYDSSIFPVRHPQYGCPKEPRFPYVLTAPCGAQIVEFPLSTAKFLGVKLPVAGGGYFRQFPYWYTHWGFKSLNAEQHPGIFYLHPWELDTEQPPVAGLSRTTQLRHYRNLDKTEARLKRLLREFPFTTVSRVLLLEGLLAPLKFKRAA